MTLDKHGSETNGRRLSGNMYGSCRETRDPDQVMRLGPLCFALWCSGRAMSSLCRERSLKCMGLYIHMQQLVLYDYYACSSLALNWCTLRCCYCTIAVGVPELQLGSLITGAKCRRHLPWLLLWIVTNIRSLRQTSCPTGFCYTR